MLNVYQRQLNLRTYKYYYQLEVDGIEGPGTIEAYRKFQADNGLVVDGIYGPATNGALISVVKGLQAKLNAKGYNLVVDGIVGDATLGAIKDFQANNGLVVDGICGPATLEKLGGYKCKYFDDSEFACGCGCGLNLTTDYMKMIADKIREHFGVPVIVTSGTRCKAYNDSLSGSIPNSWHLYGRAIDIIAQGVSGRDLLNYCQTLVNNGEANYCYQIDSQAVHIDVGNIG